MLHYCAVKVNCYNHSLCFRKFFNTLLLCQSAYQQGSLFLGYDIPVQSLYYRLFQMRCVYNAVIAFIQSDILAYNGIVPFIFGQQGMQ